MCLRHAVACCLAIAAALGAQAPSGAPADAPTGTQSKPRPRYELARALQTLGDALEQIRGASETLGEARRQAEAAEDQGKAAEVESVVRMAAELQRQIDELQRGLRQQLGPIDALRARAAAEAPASLLAPQLAPEVEVIRARIAAACALPKHLDAEQALDQIEAGLAAKQAPRLAGGESLLALTRYRLGEVLRQHGALLVRKRTASDDIESIRLLKRARSVFDRVLEAPDGAEDDVATSLHAAALLRVVQIEASLFDAYGAAKNREARLHRAAAETALDRLKRGYPGARLASGDSVAEQAEAKVRQLVR